MSYTKSQETELLSLVADGDEAAFSQVVRYYTPRVYQHLLMYIKNAHNAQELTQDVFMSVWRNRTKLKDMENVGGYIYVITRNMAIRALKEAVDELDEPPEDMIQTLLHSPELTIELKELKLILDKGIEQLPTRRKKVFRMSRVENLSYEEISTELEISKSAVKQHIIAAMVFLRTYVKQKADIIVSLLFWFIIYRL